MARHLEETDIPIEYKGMKYNVFPSALHSNNLTVELPEVVVRPTTPQTNDKAYYQRWLMRQVNRGGRNMSSSDREAYDRMMQRIANQNEVKNFTGFDGTIYNHGSGALEQVSPEFDVLTLGRQFYTDRLLNAIGKSTSKKVSKETSKQLPLTQWTPKQWTAAQDKAIAEGDMVRAQMLRDLHFKIHANPVLTQEGNMRLTHATKNKFNIFNLDKAGSGSGNLSNTEGVIHLSPYDESALDVFKTKSLEERNKYNLMHLYAHNPNPVNVDLKDFIKTFNDKNAFKKLRDAGDGIIARGQSPYKIYNDKIAEYEAKKAAGKLNMWDSKPESPTDFMEESVVDGYTINKPEYIKSADAVTYNGYGVRIPLGKRDNFRNMDIRYSFIPLSIGGKYLYNNLNNNK